MAEESEKRFHEIMDRLFHAPPNFKSKSTTTTSFTSLSGVQLSRGKKRSNMASTLAVVEPKSIGGGVEKLKSSSASGGTPLCRPWDRGDLLKRLATFKSMTWFAKPQVVGAVNCARRGWVNLDCDIIACEACGARLLFSTPSSWTRQQVEKAALVFSLKLDNGHKLLCPWVDNACDETLAEFPPLPTSVLVDNYKKRCSALLQLLALPVISSSAIDYMRSPQLEHFLKGSSTIEFGNKSADSSRIEYLENECEAVSSVLYYKAQKIISLCGWEPRSLPYVVDCMDRENMSIKDANLSVPSHRQNPSISVYTSATGENVEANDDPMASGVLYDPSSVVLDCRLCGASVGLWGFSTTPRPVEFIRVVGYAEVNGENNVALHKENVIHTTDVGASVTGDSGNGNHVECREHAMNSAANDTASLIEKPLNLNLTIAGGPPPAKQNFRPTVSLPVIGSNLRSRFSSDSDLRDHQRFKSFLQGEEDQTSNTFTGQESQLDMGLVQGRRHDDGHCNSMNNDLCLGSEINKQGNFSDCHMPLERANISGQEIPETSKHDSIIENPLESSQNVVHSFNELDKLTENAANVGTVNPAVGDLCSPEVGHFSILTPGGHVSVVNCETSVNDTSMVVAADNCCLQQNPETSTGGSKHGDIGDVHGVMARVQPVNDNIVPCCIEKGLKQQPLVKAMEFDPIRQHRHFCPWIASSGNSKPGWLQTLSALQRQMKFSYPSSSNAPSSSLIEVDDPVATVEMLFMSPSAKRTKLAHGSK